MVETRKKTTAKKNPTRRKTHQKESVGSRVHTKNEASEEPKPKDEVGSKRELSTEKQLQNVAKEEPPFKKLKTDEETPDHPAMHQYQTGAPHTLQRPFNLNS